MTTDKKETKNTRKSKQPINEKSPLLPEKHASEEFKGAPFAGAVFNLSTSIIGAGIMALPTTMKVLGLGLGLGMIVFVAVLTEASLEMLLRFSRVGKSESYGEVMGDAFGVVGRRLLQICILLNNVGTLIVYMIIIADVLSGTSSSGVHHAGVLEGWFGEQWWNSRTFVLLVTTIVVFAPLACFKRIDSLRHTSALAVALAIVFLIITAGITILKLFNGSVAMPRLLPKVTDITSIWSLFTAVPVLVTAFICHFNVHTIDNELEDSSLIQPVVKTSLALCSIIYILTSFFGFLLFGDSTLDDILANFDTNLGIPYSFLLNDVVRISYALHLMLVFPILFYPLRINLDGLFFPAARPLVANNFTGATATVCIGFIFPAAIALRDPHAIATKKDKILSVFMVNLAVFSNLVAIYSDAYTIFKKNVNTNA
ncbi:amino acid transporter AVT6A-like isoform X2 [Juglans microcarpa x Juglans regia]|uniref:amino acid transporter AVT6A-like isoform X2 n=1 Tax=Juglans microcarpa x Juglans regia TaxID=2249226 RepID=UPI001B7F5104|nr:amino acid transporter AVT6A-like isoform X2 [Juglans microcarpa x Juglans regia]